MSTVQILLHQQENLRDKSILPCTFANYVPNIFINNKMYV